MHAAEVEQSHHEVTLESYSSDKECNEGKDVNFVNNLNQRSIHENTRESDG